MPRAKKVEDVTAQTGTIAKEKLSETKATSKLTETSKAGKRSAKAIAAAHAKQEKEARKIDKAKAETSSIKPVIIRSKSRLERRSKSYRKKFALIDSKA